MSPKVPRRASASASEQGSSMVCVDCFQAKGESELRTACQNPHCHFYLQAPGSSFPAAAHRSASTSNRSFDPWSPFASRYEENPSRQFSTKSATQSASLWAYPPSSMFNLAISKESTQQKTRSHSTCFEGEADKNRTSRFLRSRLMSLPMAEVLEQVDGSDVVEDAFLSSPLFAGEEVKVR